mgnify:CR=1
MDDSGYDLKHRCHGNSLANVVPTTQSPRENRRTRMTAYKWACKTLQHRQTDSRERESDRFPLDIKMSDVIT